MFCNAAIYCAQPDQHCSHQKNISQAGSRAIACDLYNISDINVQVFAL